jgi:hypothetical protein
MRLCTVCMYGQCTTCNAPQKRSTGGATLARSAYPRDILITRPLASEPAPPPMLARRDSELPPGVRCDPGPGPVKSSDCHALAASLRGRDLYLPFAATKESCSVAVFAHYKLGKGQGRTIRGDEVADKIDRGTNSCNSYGVVPTITDSSADIETPGYLTGYYVFFGQLCGQFGHGIAECTQGEAPGRRFAM